MRNQTIDRASTSSSDLPYSSMVGGGELRPATSRSETRARIAAAQAALLTATGPEAEAARRMLSRVADAHQSEAERAAVDDPAARVAETIANAREVLAQPVAARPRNWADLRRTYLSTHPQPARAA